MYFTARNKMKLQFSNTERKQMLYEDDQTLSNNVDLAGNSSVQSEKFK